MNRHHESHDSRTAVTSQTLLESYVTPEGTVTLMQVDEASRNAMSLSASESTGIPVVTGNVWLILTGKGPNEQALRMAADLDQTVREQIAVPNAISAFVAPGTTGPSPEQQQPSATICLGYAPGRIAIPSVAIFDELAGALLRDAASRDRS